MLIRGLLLFCFTFGIGMLMISEFRKLFCKSCAMRIRFLIFGQLGFRFFWFVCLCTVSLGFFPFNGRTNFSLVGQNLIFLFLILGFWLRILNFWLISHYLFIRRFLNLLMLYIIVTFMTRNSTPFKYGLLFYWHTSRLLLNKVWFFRGEKNVIRSILGIQLGISREWFALKRRKLHFFIPHLLLICNGLISWISFVRTLKTVGFEIFANLLVFCWHIQLF